MEQDIKYGQLWARHSELVEADQVGKYRVSFEGLKKAVEEAMRIQQPNEQPVGNAGVNDSAMYELRLALYDMTRVTKALIENRGTLLNARKRVEAAEGILKKHFKITDVLRSESNEQPVEQKENEAVTFVNWLHLNAMKVSWDTGRLTNHWVYNEKAYTTTELYNEWKQSNK